MPFKIDSLFIFFNLLSMNKAWRFQWLFIHFFSCESKACKLTICNIQFILFSICLYTPHSFLIFYVGDSPSQENPGMSTVGVRARSKFLQSKYDHITENVNIQWSVRKEYFLPLHDNLLKKVGFLSSSVACLQYCLTLVHILLFIDIKAR